MTRYIPNQGDIVWISLDPVRGHEQAGKRPALVISSGEFSKLSGLAVICPISNADNGFPMHLPLPNSLNTTGAVLCEHFKSIDYAARSITFKEKCPHQFTHTVIDYVKAILE